MTDRTIPPLALESIFLDNLLVDGPEPLPSQRSGTTPLDITIGYGVAGSTDDPLHRVLTLTVEVRPNGQNVPRPFPLRIGAQITGRFRISDNVPEVERDKMLRMEGCSLLYGSLRGMVAPLVAMLRVQGFVLPVVDMHTIVERLMLQEQTDKQSPRRKPPSPSKKGIR